MLIKRLTIVALAALTLACGDDRPVLRVVTNGTSFQRELTSPTATTPIAVVPYDMRNRGDATAFVSTCGTRVLPEIDKLVNGRWENYSGAFCMMSMVMVPLELREGETHHDDVAISEAGRYRLRVPYSSDAQLRNHFESVSGAFDVQ
jgi:hypothetical protein